MATGIDYLLPRGTFAAWHRVTSDELWHFYDGQALTLYLLDERQRRLETVVLGRDVTQGERPQVLVPPGVLQAARTKANTPCAVAPGPRASTSRIGRCPRGGAHLFTGLQ